MIHKKCNLCKILKPLTDFHRNASKPNGVTTYCRECTCIKAKQYNKKYRSKSKEAISIKAKQTAALNKKQIFDHYGNRCSCCGEDNPSFLTIDHINNDGNKYRKSISGFSVYYWIIKNNYPDYLRLLCWNCNSGRACNGNICPHEQESKPIDWIRFREEFLFKRLT